MPTTSETTKRYFQALAEHDLDTAISLWSPGAIDRFAGGESLIAPDGIRSYFTDLFAAFPDFQFEIVDATTYRERCAVRWKASATFAGPGRFQGFAANGARIAIEGCDVVTVKDGVIVANDAYLDSADVARQLGLLPPAGSPAERTLARVANFRTRVAHAAVSREPEAIAPGVWIIRGSIGRSLSVYLIEEPDGSGVTVFDGGARSMAPAIAAAGARLGGIKRIVLGHVDCDHRGAAPGLGAPVYVHPNELDAARSSSERRDYWRLSELAPWARPVYPGLFRLWDGGALEVAGTIAEDDPVAGFRVIDLPGHAPGLIALFREEDRLALVSDTVYTVNVNTGIPGAARVPHKAFNFDDGEARVSIHKLADLEPAVVWPGHSHPVSGADVRGQLERAAAV
jgi:hydroxyacylglutathione hydrolase